MHIPDAIPFLDLVTPHVELKDELTAVFLEALSTGAFVGGAMVEEFERAFGEFCDSRYAITASSGTDALRFALIACGVQPGEVAVTVPNTFIATTEAISQAGAIPEFVDVDEATYNMSVESLRTYLERNCTRGLSGRLISRRSNLPVKAIVPVHLYGQMADMDAILALAEEFNLIVIEDACQAHGAQYFSRRSGRWLKAGSVGKAAAFSFYPGKNLGACGEAGAVTTHDPDVALRIKRLRDHGQTQKYYHEVEGYNGRLDSIQAGLLHVKLQYLSKWNAQRRERAAEYNRLLADNPAVLCPYEPTWSHAVYHLYVVRVADRDSLISYLKACGIGTGIHYPVPLHMQRAYTSLGYHPADFPVATRVADKIVSLPMFPQLTAGQQAGVVEQIRAFTLASARKEPAEIAVGVAEMTA